MFRSIANTLGNCFKIPELKSRILFTIMLLAVCRLTAFIVIPGIDGQKLAQYFNDNAQSGGGLLVMSFARRRRTLKKSDRLRLRGRFGGPYFAKPNPRSLMLRFL